MKNLTLNQRYAWWLIKMTSWIILNHLMYCKWYDNLNGKYFHWFLENLLISSKICQSKRRIYYWLLGTKDGTNLTYISTNSIFLKSWHFFIQKNSSILIFDWELGLRFACRNKQIILTAPINWLTVHYFVSLPKLVWTHRGRHESTDRTEQEQSRTTSSLPPHLHGMLLHF